jgi:hypothetical protein
MILQLMVLVFTMTVNLGWMEHTRRNGRDEQQIDDCGPRGASPVSENGGIKDWIVRGFELALKQPRTYFGQSAVLMGAVGGVHN